jgi:hypothetical protein
MDHPEERLATTFYILIPTANDHLEDDNEGRGVDRMSHGGKFEGYLR